MFQAAVSTVRRKHLLQDDRPDQSHGTGNGTSDQLSHQRSSIGKLTFSLLLHVNFVKFSYFGDCMFVVVHSDCGICAVTDVIGLLLSQCLLSAVLVVDVGREFVVSSFFCFHHSLGSESVN